MLTISAWNRQPIDSGRFSTSGEEPEPSSRARGNGPCGRGESRSFRRARSIIYVLCLRGPAFSTPGAASVLKECHTIHHATLSETVRPIFQDLLYEQTVGDEGSELIASGQALELLGQLLRWKKRKDDSRGEPPETKSLSRARVGAIITEMQRRFYRFQSLEEAATRASLKSRRFSQIFREMAGMSWPAFLREKRIHHAKRLLVETHRSVIAISFECGFNDLSSFYRAFKQMEGTSPLAWRKRSAPHSIFDKKTKNPCIIPTGLVT